MNLHIDTIQIDRMWKCGDTVRGSNGFKPFEDSQTDSNRDRLIFRYSDRMSLIWRRFAFYRNFKSSKCFKFHIDRDLKTRWIFRSEFYENIKTQISLQKCNGILSERKETQFIIKNTLNFWLFLFPKYVPGILWEQFQTQIDSKQVTMLQISEIWKHAGHSALNFQGTQRLKFHSKNIVNFWVFLFPEYYGNSVKLKQSQNKSLCKCTVILYTKWLKNATYFGSTEYNGNPIQNIMGNVKISKYAVICRNTKHTANSHRHWPMPQQRVHR